MTVTSGAGLVLQPGASCGCPRWMQDSQDVVYLLLLFQVHLQRAGSEVKQLGQEPVPIWAADIVGVDLTGYATMPVPKYMYHYNERRY